MSGIPFDQREGFIWLDGEFVEWSQARLHVLTHGLHYASTVYEGERVYNGKIFKLREHSERLYRSAQLMDFVIPYELAELEAASRRTAATQQRGRRLFAPGGVARQ